VIADQSIRGKKEQRGVSAVDVTTVIFPSGPPQPRPQGLASVYFASSHDLLAYCALIEGTFPMSNPSTLETERPHRSLATQHSRTRLYTPRHMFWRFLESHTIQFPDRGITIE